MNSGLTIKKFGQGFQSIVLGSGKHFPLERKVLNAALFASTIVALLLTVASLMFPISGPGIYLAMGGSVLFMIFYLTGRRKQESYWLAWVYLIIMSGLVLLIWRFSSGLAGIAPIIILALASSIPLILPPKEHIGGFLLVACVVGAIYLMTIFSMDTIPHQPFNISYVHNKMIGIIAVACGISLVSVLVINTHHRNLTKIMSLFESLEELNETVEERNLKLENALGEIKTLRGIVPICAYCKKIRNDKGYYESVEDYVEKHTYAEFSHGFCPECAKEHFPEFYDDTFEA